MPTQDKIEAIRKACAVANPEIMKLEMGCRGIWQTESEDSKEIHILATILRPHEKFGIIDIVTDKPIAHNEYLGSVATIFPSNFTVLGRDIHLADVLLVAETKLRWSGTSILSLWNFRKDNLNDQTPETIDFIYQLIK